MNRSEQKIFDDVYQDYLFYTCNNTGQENSYCSNYTDPFLIQDCEFGCNNGFCITWECVTDSDCGENQFYNKFFPPPENDLQKKDFYTIS